MYTITTLKKEGPEFVGYTQDDNEIRVYEVLDELLVDVDEQTVYETFLENHLMMDDVLDGPTLRVILEQSDVFEFAEDYEYYEETADEFDAWLSQVELGEDFEDEE